MRDSKKLIIGFCIVVVAIGVAIFWIVSNKNQQITFDTVGGKIGSDEKISIKWDDDLTLPIPKKEGYEFEGWYTKADGGEKITKASDINNTKVVYAHWKTQIGLSDDSTAYTFKVWNSLAETINHSISDKEVINVTSKTIQADPNIETGGVNTEFTVTGKKEGSAIVTVNVEKSDDGETTIKIFDYYFKIDQNLKVTFEKMTSSSKIDISRGLRESVSSSVSQDNIISITKNDLSSGKDDSVKTEFTVTGVKAGETDLTITITNDKNSVVSSKVYHYVVENDLDISLESIKVISDSSSRTVPVNPTVTPTPTPIPTNPNSPTSVPTVTPIPTPTPTSATTNSTSQTSKYAFEVWNSFADTMTYDVSDSNIISVNSQVQQPNPSIATGGTNTRLTVTGKKEGKAVVTVNVGRNVDNNRVVKVTEYHFNVDKNLKVTLDKTVKYNKIIVSKIIIETVTYSLSKNNIVSVSQKEVAPPANISTGPTTELTIKGLTAGKVDLDITVKDSKGKITSSKTYRITVDSNLELSIISLSETN